MTRPGFFIVGAPKCGTTALNNYLSQHPDIYMAKKELHYFGSDLKVKERISESEYLDYFKNAGTKKIAGEASVWYLFSKNAAREIKAFCPQAKIIIMLRDPVEMLHSLHSQHLIDANEDVRNFRKAVQLDAGRKSGRNKADSLEFYELPSYKETVSYFSQVERYLNIFGKGNVRIILYDDLKSNVNKVVDETIRFLGLQPNTDTRYKVINPRKKIRFLKLHRVMKHPSANLRKMIRIMVPVKRLRHLIMTILFQLNTNEKQNQTREKDFDRDLRKFLAGDIKKLGVLINRDLTSWMNSE